MEKANEKFVYYELLELFTLKPLKEYRGALRSYFDREREILSVVYKTEKVRHSISFNVSEKSALIISKEINQFVDETKLKNMF